MQERGRKFEERALLLLLCGARLKVVGHAITPSLVNTYTVGL